MGLGEYLCGDDIERFGVLAELVNLLHYYATYKRDNPRETKNAAKDSLEDADQSQRLTLPMERLQAVLDLLLGPNGRSIEAIKAESRDIVMSSPSTLPSTGIKAEPSPDTLDDPAQSSSSTITVKKDVDFLPSWSSATTHTGFMGFSNRDQGLKPYKNIGRSGSVAFAKSATKVEINETLISDNSTPHSIRHQYRSDDHSRGICELVGLSSFLYARYRDGGAAVDLDMVLSVLRSILRMASPPGPPGHQSQTEGAHFRAIHLLELNISKSDRSILICQVQRLYYLWFNNAH